MECRWLLSTPWNLFQSSRQSTPPELEVWTEALSNHPDHGFVNYIFEGLHNGFRVGFDYTSCTTTPAKGTMLSAVQHADSLTSISKRVRKRENSRPLVFSKCTFSISERIWSHPKKQSTGPQRERWDFSLWFMSVDNADAEICASTLLSKLDIKNAYRTVPVHPEDHPLLGNKI